MYRCVFVMISALTIAGCMARSISPLERAAAAGDISALNRLIQAGASLADIQGGLVAAAREDGAAAVPVLVRNGADPNATSGVNGWTVLMHAVHKNQAASVDALLSSGADPNRRGEQGGTPLAMAAGYGQAEIVRALLNAGADPRSTPSPLEAAIRGTGDIDNWTAGHCQAGAVRVLLERAPDTATRDLLDRVSNKLSRCPDVAALVRRAHA